MVRRLYFQVFFRIVIYRRYESGPFWEIFLWSGNFSDKAAIHVKNVN